MKFFLVKHLVLIFFAGCFLGGSVFVMVPVKNEESTAQVFFGYPVGFVSQDFSLDYKKYKNYPWYQHWDNHRPFVISWNRLIVSWGITWAGLSGIIWFFETIRVPYLLRRFRGNKRNIIR